jgi:hypothetical protein
MLFFFKFGNFSQQKILVFRNATFFFGGIFFVKMCIFENSAQKFKKIILSIIIKQYHGRQ